MKGIEPLTSSQSDEWTTPEWIFKQLDDEFGFNLDPCCTHDSALCERHYTKEEDGLKKSWGGATVFVNPPYSQISKWVEKSYTESLKPGTLVCMLIPARTDTKYFHDYILNRSEVRFIKGRLKFSESKNSAPFPSMVVIFRSAKYKKEGTP